MKSLWPSGQVMNMESFITDPRIVKWFVQNYDLIGCNLFTCSNVVSPSIIDKVAPIPIGIVINTNNKTNSNNNTNATINRYRFS